VVNSLYGPIIRSYLESHGLFRPELWVPFDVKKSAKGVNAVLELLELVERARLSRRAPMLLIGGGTLLDIGGLAASLYRRGVPFVRIPTTLVGMIDAGIGIKNGVNFGGHKNRLGTFSPPLAVFNDTDFLKTLTTRDLRQGLSEIAKMGIVSEARLFDLLESHGAMLLAEHFPEGEISELALDLSVSSMLDCLAPNLYEDATLQRVVDFGHTLSPWLEMKSNGRMPHGDAVAVDMALFTVVARRLQRTSEETQRRVVGLLLKLGLPVWNDACRDVTEMCAALEDVASHRGGALHAPIPVSVGRGEFLEWTNERGEVDVELRASIMAALAGASEELAELQRSHDRLISRFLRGPAEVTLELL
jgi:3-dehydroquinate synthase